MEKLRNLELSEQGFYRIPRGISVGEHWGRADLHLHARDGVEDPYLLAAVAKERGLNVIAITEHDNGENFGLIWKIGREFDLEVFAGSEVTALGPNPVHLLVLFPDPDCVPSQEVHDRNFGRFITLRQLIENAHHMGGICIAPHPTSPLTFSMGSNHLEELQKGGSGGFYLDGIEVLNPTPAGFTAMPNALGAFSRGGLGGAVGGSDARLPEHVGICQTRWSGKTKEELIAALRAGQTVAEGRFHSTSENLAIAGQQLVNFARKFRQTMGVEGV